MDGSTSMSLARRAGLAAALSLLLLAAATRAIGMPDLALAGDFFTSSYQTQAAGIAAAGVLVWLAVGALVAANLALATRTAASAVQLLRTRRQRAVAIFLSGILVLGMGLVRHSQAGFSFCCGSIDAARQQTNLLR